ncbi:MAG TPA: hypothetical protein VF815_31695, partial [Myxococcaceae bacterium]
MRRLKLRETRPDDELDFRFEAAFNPQAPLERELEPFLQALETFAGDWMPDVVEGKRRRKYSRAAFWKALEEERDENWTTIGLYRTKAPALDMTFKLWFRRDEPELSISVVLRPLSFFAEEKRSRHFVEMVRAWASHYPVTYAKAHSEADAQLAGAPNYGRDDETLYRDWFDKIYEVCWLNVFGPKLVKTVGRER